MIATGLFLGVAVHRAREAAYESSCIGHTCQLSVALAHYYDSYRSFPPRIGERADAKTVNAIELLVSTHFFDEPWNEVVRDFLTCPSSRSEVPDYLLVAGPGTIFDGKGAYSALDVSDGVENTLVFVEAGDLQTRGANDWEIEIADLPRVTDSSGCIPAMAAHPLGRGLIFADGLIFRLIRPLSANNMRALMTIAGNEMTTREDLIAGRYLSMEHGWKRIPKPDP